MSNFNGNVTSENQISGRMTPSQSLNGRLDARREIVTPANFEDLADVEVNNVQDGQVPKYNAETGKWENKDDAAGDEAVWGNIHGDLADQTDLIEALSAKQDTLTFDDYPRDLSGNPVTSRGIYQSIQGSDVLIDKTVGYVKKNLFHVDSSVVSSSSNGFNTMVYRNSEGEVTEIDLWGTATDPSIETVFDLGAFNVNVGTFILSGGIDDDIFLRAIRIRSGGREDIVEDKGSGVEFMNSVMLGMFNHAYLVVKNPEIGSTVTICPMIRNVEIASDKFYPYNSKETVQKQLDNKVITLTKQEYDALSSDEKNDPDKVYYVTDYDPVPVYAELDDSVTAADKVWSSQKVNTQKADNSVIAPVESGTTASRAYAIGEHFIKSGAFCTAKTAIASGAAFTLNTNYTAGTIGEMLFAKLAYASVTGTTNTAGSIPITTNQLRFVIGVYFNSLGQNYTWRLGQSGITTYLHVMDEAGNAAAGVNVNVTYLYIDF